MCIKNFFIIFYYSQLHLYLLLDYKIGVWQNQLIQNELSSKNGFIKILYI